MKTCHKILTTCKMYAALEYITIVRDCLSFYRELQHYQGAKVLYNRKRDKNNI